MVKQRTLKTVAIVGRPNVGKSALFNRLAGRDISIVHDMPGVTRDRIIAECRRVKPYFTMVDTGGIGETLDDNLQNRVRAEAEIAMEASDLILLVVDGRAGVTPIDEQLAQVLRRSQRSVLLVVNKIDTDKQANMDGDFARLGFETRVRMSAEHGRGLKELLEEITKRLGAGEAEDEAEEPEENSDDIEEGREGGVKAARPSLNRGPKPLRVAIVGRPNVGKSSLVNAILDDERTIVSNIAGTTRDAVDIPCRINNQPYILVDTAGIRRQAKIEQEVEFFSIRSARQSIRKADICALMIDCSEKVSSQDRKIAQLILREDKPCIILANKFDLYHTGIKQSERLAVLKEELGRELFFLHYAPTVIISAKKRQHLDKIFLAIEEVRAAADEALGTGNLNRLLQQALTQNPPPMKGGRRFNLLYASRTKPEHPRPVEVPHYILFGNRVDHLDSNYLRYLENRLREQVSFTGLPIRLTLRGKDKRE